jgi:hypothetical protein
LFNQAFARRAVEITAASVLAGGESLLVHHRPKSAPAALEVVRAAIEGTIALADGLLRCGRARHVFGSFVRESYRLSTALTGGFRATECLKREPKVLGTRTDPDKALYGEG